MARYKREPKGKVINPKFFVFCEGESEAAYINHLRHEFHKRTLLSNKSKKIKYRTQHKAAPT
jgi:hypothetical protein